MSYRTEETNIAVIRLSQLEGQQLCAILEHSIARADQGYDPCLVASALESLGDANDLARWLRENVALELRPEEIVAVLQVLESGHECCKRCSSISVVLGGICDQLKRCLETQSATVGQGSAFPALAQLGGPCLSDSLAATH